MTGRKKETFRSILIVVVIVLLFSGSIYAMSALSEKTISEAEQIKQTPQASTAKSTPATPAKKTCNWPSCNKEVFLNYDYCIDHICDNGTCPNPVAYDGVHYCAEHMAFLYDQELVNSNGKMIYKVYARDDILHFNGTFTGDGYFGITIKDANQDFYALVANEIGSYIVDKSISVTKDQAYYIEAETTNGYYQISWIGTYGRNPNE